MTIKEIRDKARDKIAMLLYNEHYSQYEGDGAFYRDATWDKAKPIVKEKYFEQADIILSIPGVAIVGRKT